MIEAMACGTPVLGFRHGSVPEVIDDGITGFVVDDIESAIAAIPSLLSLDRRRVRQRFEERFTAARMAESYVSLYSRAFASYGRAAKVHTEDAIAPSIETVVN